MSNSPLVDYTRLSPNRSSPRGGKISKITIHHMAGVLSVETCGAIFAESSRQASSNYGVDTDGRVGLYVDEANRSWASSSTANDNVAVTIEVANSAIGGDWPVSDTALAKTIELCADICRRNGIIRLNFTGDASGNLTQHNYFAATACPGPYLKSKFKYIADEVNKILEEEDMTGEEILNKINEYTATQQVPDWAQAELREAVDAGITDGTNPMQLIPRYQAAIMALRAKNGTQTGRFS